MTISNLTVTKLTPGVYYDFTVESRNLVGYSLCSELVTILAAQIPDPPTRLQNVPLITN